MRQFMPQSNQNQEVMGYLSPTEQIKRDVIQLAKEATDHYSKSLDSEQEKWAFYVKSRVLSLRLKGFMSIQMRIWLRDFLMELEKKIDDIENSEKLSPENKKINSLNLQYNYALRIYDVCIELLHNCPIVETKSDSVVELDLKEIEDRVRLRSLTRPKGDVKAKPVRKEKQDTGMAFDIEQVGEEDIQEENNEETVEDFVEDEKIEDNETDSEEDK